jgi:hypothetical protein
MLMQSAMGRATTLSTEHGILTVHAASQERKKILGAKNLSVLPIEWPVWMAAR